MVTTSILCIVSGGLGASIARDKRRSMLGWGLLCFVFPPAVFALIYLPFLSE
jgi:hypothetical protein